MTLQLGTLQADVELDASGLTKGEAEVTKSMKRIDSSLKKADKQIQTTAKKSLPLFGRQAGQAGIQLQQFVGQIQGGQSAMLALSQQSADLGIVLGAPLVGAVVGIGSAIAGMLLPSLFDSKDATEELEAAMKSLDEIMGITEDDVDTLSESFVELAKKSEAAARIEIAKGLLDAGKAAKAAAQQMEDAYDDTFLSMTVSAETFASQSQEALKRGFNLEQILSGTAAGQSAEFTLLRGELEQLQEEFGLTSKEAGDLGEAISRNFTEKSAKSASELRAELSGLIDKYGQSNKELVEFSATISNSAGALIEISDRTLFLTEAQENLNKAVEESEEVFSKTENKLAAYIKQLEIQVDVLALSGVKLAEYKANLVGATGEEKEHIIALLGKIDAHKKEVEAQKEASKALQDYESVRRSLLDQEDSVKENHQDRLEKLSTALEMEQITRDEFNTQRLASEKKLSDDLSNLDKKRLADQQQQQMIQLQVLSSFHDTANALIESAGKEGTALAKAAFLAGKAIQVATIIANTQVAASAAAAVAAAGGPQSFFATEGAILAAGYASAGLVSGLAVGEAFENGGIVGGSSFTGDKVPARVNSGEMILNRGQQSKLFAMANGDNSSGGGSNITINNNVGADVSASTMSDGQIMIQIDKARKGAVNDVNQSLATGRGSTAKSLNQGFKTERNIR